MSNAVQEFPAFESTIRDNPLESLKTFSSIMYNPLRTFYPLLLLANTLSSLLNIKKIDDEKMMYSHKMFSREQNLAKSQLGKHVLDEFVENTVGDQQDMDVAKRTLLN